MAEGKKANPVEEDKLPWTRGTNVITSEQDKQKREQRKPPQADGGMITRSDKPRTTEETKGAPERPTFTRGPKREDRKEESGASTGGGFISRDNMKVGPKKEETAPKRPPPATA